jgi:hypothetical protein
MKIDLPKLPELNGGGYSADALARMLTDYAEKAVRLERERLLGPAVDEPVDLTQAKRLIVQLRGRVADLNAALAAPINLNSRASVTLSANGAEVFNAYYDRLYALMPPAAQEYKPARAAAGHVHEDQLWSILQIFGPNIIMGMASPFDPNGITILKRV